VRSRCSKSRGGAALCRQPYLREEALEAQLARQVGAIQLDGQTLAGLRGALTELHGQERQYRAAALTALRTRYDDVQKKKDILLDRHLAGVVPDDEYKRKIAALKEEQIVIETELHALEVAQERFFEEAELLLQLAGRLGEVFEQGTEERKLAVLKLVASNATLKGRNARLNLFPPFEVLAKARGHTRWLGEEDSNPR